MIAITVAMSKPCRQDALDLRDFGNIKICNLPIAEMIRRPLARDGNDVILLGQDPGKRRTRDRPAPLGAERPERCNGREVGREVRLDEARVGVAEVDDG